jgi:RHS repeat-associated protein
VTHGGLKWRYEHDSVGRLSAQTDYNGSTTQYWYDPAGQLVHRVNASGHEASFGYNSIGKLVYHHVADGTVTKFDWDPAGRLLRAWNDDVNLVLVRDSLGRVVSESCNGRAVTRTYDVAGNVTSRVTPSGAATTWVYAATGTPSVLTAGGRELRFGHDPAGRETTRQLPGGAVITQRWDQVGRLVAQDLTGPAAPEPLRRRAYTFGPDGFVSKVADALAGDWNFQRDAAGHLTIVTGEGGGHPARYQFDPVGNLVNVAGPAAAVSDMPSQGAREINGTLTARAGNVRYGYDATGRVISRTLTGTSGDPETWRYTWDANSHLHSVTLPDGSTWQYQYDPLGRRIGKRHLSADGRPVGETQFSWDGPLLAEQRDLHGDTEQVTTWTYRSDSGIPLTQASGEEFHCLVTGQGGTPTELVSPDGSVAGDATTPLRGPGRYHDQETGLQYHNHRYYDPETGVYLSPAPGALSSGPNPHAYLPDPVAFSNPPRLLSGDEAAAVVREMVSAIRAGTNSRDKVLGETCSAAWIRTADHWIGSLLHSSRHLPVAAGVDGFDARLFTGEPALGAGYNPRIPLKPGE